MYKYMMWRNENEYYEYVQSQMENYTDLTTDTDNSAKKMATILFSQDVNVLKENISRIIPSEGMDIQDLFCMLIEILLYGIDMKTGGEYTLMDMDDSSTEIIDKISEYFKSIGFKISMEKKDNMDISEYRNTDDYYCEITDLPISLIGKNSWCVLRYMIIYNHMCNIEKDINKMKTLFVTSDKKIYTIQFEILAK